MFLDRGGKEKECEGRGVERGVKTRRTVEWQISDGEKERGG